MNPHELVWNQSGYHYLTLLDSNLMHGEGLEPPKSHGRLIYNQVQSPLCHPC